MSSAEEVPEDIKALFIKAREKTARDKEFLRLAEWIMNMKKVPGFNLMRLVQDGFDYTRTNYDYLQRKVRKLEKKLAQSAEVILKERAADDFARFVEGLWDSAKTIGTETVMKWMQRATELGYYDEDTKKVKMKEFVEDACVPPDTLIMTNYGVLTISDIVNGQPQFLRSMNRAEVRLKVLTHKGRFMSVVKTFKRSYTGKLIKIESYGARNIPLLLTPNHPVLVVDSEGVGWMKAEKLNVGDEIAFPIPKETSDLDINDHLLRIIGWFLAEGSFLHNGLQFDLNINDDYLGLCQDLQKEFDCRPSVKIIGEVARVTVHNMELRDWFVQFGHGAKNKRLPHWALLLPREKTKILLETYWNGDGGRFLYQHSGKEYNRSKCNSVSSELIAQLRLLQLKIGIRPTVVYIDKSNIIGTIEGRDVNYNDIWQLEYTVNPQKTHGIHLTEKFLTMKIRTIETIEYDGEVYNLKVKEDESYCTYAHCVHNCNFYLEKRDMLETVDDQVRDLQATCTMFAELSKPQVLRIIALRSYMDFIGLVTQLAARGVPVPESIILEVKATVNDVIMSTYRTVTKVQTHD